MNRQICPENHFGITRHAEFVYSYLTRVIDSFCLVSKKYCINSTWLLLMLVTGPRKARASNEKLKSNEHKNESSYAYENMMRL